jgi:excisionase family DNA binding protein
MADLNEQMESGGHFVSVADAARYLGVGRKVVYQLIEYNRVRAVRRRQFLLVDQESLEEFQRTGQMT